MTRRFAVTATVVLMVVLAALCPSYSASAQASTATATYTPIPTRTPYAATQAVIVVQMDDGTPLQINRSVSYGDVFLVTSIAAVFCLGALYWAYAWVKDHIRVQEQ